MCQQKCPELSAIIVTPDHLETIHRTLDCLQAQTARDRMEVVIVAPALDQLDLGKMTVMRFHFRQIVGIGEVRSMAQANAIGVQRARAPIIAMVEEHSYPDPSWAEALLAAQRAPWVAVGPIMSNANPVSAVSWADFLIAYAPWLEVDSTAPVDHLPGHHTSYKREVLLQYGAELEAMLESESVMHWDLRARGHQLRLEPSARVSHLSFGLLSPWLTAQFHVGRLFATARARHWPCGRRLFYALSTPLIPLIRFYRILAQVRRSGAYARTTPAVLALLSLGLAVSAAGEMLGYVLGSGASTRRLSDLEFHRERYVIRH